MKKVFVCLAIAILLTACASPTPAPTLAPTAVSAPTNTPAPTNTVAPTNTATPAPTATPAATATPACAASESNNLTVLPMFTSDNKYMVLGTGCGVEVFEAQTLKPVATYGGLVLANVTPDGRIVARTQSNVVLIDLATGKAETLKTKIDFTGVTRVSSTGALVAKIVDAKTVRLFEANSDKTTDIALQVQTLDPERNILLSRNGALLAVEFYTVLHAASQTISDPYVAVYEIASGKKLYEMPSFFGRANFSPDSKYLFPTATRVHHNIYDAATGKVALSFKYNIMNCRGAGSCGKTSDGSELVEDRADLVNYFIAGGLENVITFWEHTITSVPPGVVVTQENFATAYKDVRTEETYVEDFVANKRKAAFLTGGLKAEDFAYGAGAADGAVFLLVKKAGGLTLYSGKDGKAIMNLDRFKLK